MAKPQKTQATQVTTLFNRAQKEGLARIFDGFSILEGATLFTYIAGRLELSNWEVGGLIFTLCFTIYFSLYLRKD
ncbi:MAG: hypothetical protein QM537_05220 [Candidatus Symbiobacter sp.]|nr:hypothetical protein [Candidatus Symbiobacter sp.]